MTNENFHKLLTSLLNDVTAAQIVCLDELVDKN